VQPAADEPVTQYAPGAPEPVVVERRQDVFDDTPQVRQRSERSTTQGENSGFELQIAAQVAKPSDASPGNIALERCGATCRIFRQRKRVARIRAGERGKQQRQVGHGACHRSVGRKLAQIDLGYRSGWHAAI
jgi:hypothetical protein